ncbi:MAG TPA: thiamine pyrophosphate-dependent enzyme [Planctomycetota bacterium]|nr:thiamine pyrophosphate-dependent enzyme [Planctomycetota bacterium]
MSAPVESRKSRIALGALKKAPGSATPRADKPRTRKHAAPPPNLFAKALDIAHEDAIEIFRRMLRIRALGRAHWIGCEAALASMGLMITPDDVVHSTVAASDEDVITAARGLAHLTKTADLSGTALAGVRFLEGSVALAPGAALTCRLQRKRQITVTLVDEVGTAGGAFFETIQLALAWELPLLLIAFHPPPDPRTATQGRTWVARAETFGMSALRCDGLCALEMRDAVRDAAAHVRGHKGPFLLDVMIPPSARNAGLDADSARYDPVILFRQRLIEAGALNEETAAQLERETLCGTRADHAEDGRRA